MQRPPPVPDYHGIDRARFEAEIVPAGRPAVLRGLVADWPIVAAARESADALAAYLRREATDVPAEAWFGNPSIAGRFDFDAGLTGFNHERKLATIDQLLDLLLRQRGSAPWSIYAGALPVAKHVPGFLVANPMPLLDDTRAMLVSLWLGNRTQTAAHWDLPQNLACVVSGRRRRFTLFPTDQVANLYVGPIDTTLAGQPSSLVDVARPDLDRFPRYAEALAQAEVAELEPGDALYLPSLWWQRSRAATRSARWSISGGATPPPRRRAR